MANTKITNRVLDKTVITGQSAVTVADGDYILVADASDSSALKKVLASDLIQSSEEVADIVGAMVSSNTESGITVAYQDADNTIDFTVGTLNQNTTGSAATLTTARTIGGTSFDGSANIAVGLAATATALATSRTIHGVGFDGSANIDLSEVIQDTVGAMVSSNTETNITVTYQDADGTIDFVVDAAQPNVTSLGTLTALDVDNINLNGNTLTTTSSDFIVDASHDIILDADGSNVTFKDGGTSRFDFLLDASPQIKATGGTFDLENLTQDAVIRFNGNDGGSVITALRLDMADAGTAIFNNKLGVGTASPASGIHLTKSTSGNYLRMDDGSNNLWDFKATTNEGIVQVQGTGFSSWKPMDLRANYFTFKPSNTEKMTVKSDGITATTSARITQVALTSASTVSWDSTAAANAMLVPGVNLTIGSPSNSVEGAVISIEIAMNGTPRTIAWHTVFEFAASTAPVATATANKTDIFTFRYNGSVWQEIGRVQNMAQT